MLFYNQTIYFSFLVLHSCVSSFAKPAFKPCGHSFMSTSWEFQGALGWPSPYPRFSQSGTAELSIQTSKASRPAREFDFLRNFVHRNPQSYGTLICTKSWFCVHYFWDEPVVEVLSGDLTQSTYGSISRAHDEIFASHHTLLLAGPAKAICVAGCTQLAVRHCQIPINALPRATEALWMKWSAARYDSPDNTNLEHGHCRLFFWGPILLASLTSRHSILSSLLVSGGRILKHPTACTKAVLGWSPTTDTKLPAL